LLFARILTNTVKYDKIYMVQLKKYFSIRKWGHPTRSAVQA
jgi:hypothetical protein